MENSKYYIQHKGKVISTDKKHKLVMAVALNSQKKYKEGIIRCIVNRKGNLMDGSIDRSEIHLLKGKSLYKFDIGEKIKIKNEKEVIDKINNNHLDFLGLEDPDLWFDKKNKLLHLYFTIPLLSKDKNKKSKIHLGHAVGKNLNSLIMKNPVLLADSTGGAKELSIAPINKKGVRLNLVESSDKIKEEHYSTVRVAIAKDMNGPWKFGKTAFHPAEHPIRWIGGHASPGPFFSRNFINVGEGKLLGIMNGCEANKMRQGKKIFGTFSVGLFIYDYEKGIIDWISKKPFLDDSKNKKRKITFASQFVETGKGKGVLYAHVDDSFVRAYTLEAKKLRELLPSKYQ